MKMLILVHMVTPPRPTTLLAPSITSRISVFVFCWVDNNNFRFLLDEYGGICDSAHDCRHGYHEAAKKEDV